MIDQNRLKTAVTGSRIRFRQHAAEMMIERNISRDEVYDTILNGEVLEEYKNDRPFPSCLIFYYGGKIPVHVVCAYNSIDDYAVVITVYMPDGDHFQSDYKTRRKKHE